MREFGDACRFLTLLIVAGQACFAQIGQARQRAAELILRQVKPELKNIQGPSGIKCGTSLIAWAYIHWRELPALDKREIASALQRPVMQKDRLSPSGRFRIHYDTTGIDAPALITTGPAPQRIENTYEQYVDSVATIFDFCLRQETDSLGYAEPPPDGQQGGGPEYDIYIEPRTKDDFGAETPVDLIEDGPRQRFSSFIVIDNDYLDFRTAGMDGLKITAAHEFHHAVQVGAYGIWNTVPNSDFYFYELTSVWMEHVLYPSIHDYYFDLPTYFERFRDSQGRSYSFTTWEPPTFAGYERSIWAHFLVKRFGQEVMREIWEGMRANPFLQSVSEVLQRHGSTIESEFSLFSYWNFFTADRADSVRFYAEGASYPRYVPNATVAYDGLTAVITTSGFPLSTQFYQFSISNDTLVAVVANIEADQAEEASTTPRSLGLTLASGNVRPPNQRLAKGYVVGFTSANPGAWRTLYLESATRSSASIAPDAAPNPLRLSRDSKLSLPIPGATRGDAHIYMFGSSLDLVFSEDYPVTESFGNKMITIPADALRSRVPSGVYFVIARCGDQEFKWKVAILQ